MATIPGYVKAVRRVTGFGGRRSRLRPKLSPAAALVRRHDRDRFHTALFAPASRREALFALYAFNCEIARVRERVSEPTLGRIRLEWWRESVAAAYEGGPVRRHEVVEPLTAAIREMSLSRAHFARLIDAREEDLGEAPPPDLAALEGYAEASSAPLVALALEALGVRDAAVEAAGRHVGIAYALAGLLRAMPFEAAARRPVIPVEIAERTGLDARDYRARRTTPALVHATGEIAAAARAHLAAARAAGRPVPRAALPALLPAVIAGRALARLERAGHDPFAPALALPDPLQTWRLAAAALRRRF
jgi:NADH dehydrogenase [ubiquinone] 1 alpha subcomplex assembly factor 6